MSRSLLLAIGSAALALSCSRSKAEPAPTPPPSPPSAVATATPSGGGRHCFDVAVGGNSASTNRVFAAKGCQGGGVTWAAILAVLVKRRGPTRPVETTGWNGDVRDVTWSGGVARVSIDEEGDASQVCSDSARLNRELQDDVKRLNAQPALLERAMAEANGLDLECSGKDEP